MITDLRHSLLLRAIQRFDISVFSWVMARPRFNHWATLSKQISRSADGFLYPLLALLFYWHGLGWLAAAMACAFAIERPLYWIMKNSFKRFRPPDCLPGVQSVVVPSDRFSFPSGHTSGAFVSATLFAAALPELALCAYGWSCAVGWSRVCLGVHFPTDTLVGGLLGLSCAQLALSYFLPVAL